MVTSLALRMDGVDLKCELRCKLVDRLHRRQDRFLPLLLEGSDGPRADVEGRAVLPNSNGNLAAIRSVLSPHRDPAALAGKNHRDRTDEDVDTPICLFDRIDLDVDGQFADQLITPIPKTVRAAAGASGRTLGHRDLGVERCNLVEQTVCAFYRHRERPIRFFAQRAVLVAEEIDMIGETDPLLDDHGSHRIVERIVRQFAERVEERRELRREIVVGEFVLDALDRRKKPLVDHRRVLITDRVTQSGLQRRINGAVDRRQSDPGSHELVATDRA